MLTKELEEAFREIVENDTETLAFTVVATEVIALEQYRDVRNMILFYLARALERVNARRAKKGCNQ
jgi:hypothetical protein